VGRKTKGTGTHCAIASNKEDIPKNGTMIDATAPIARVVDEILRQCEADKPGS
jgi:hypothetical protein